MRIRGDPDVHCIDFYLPSAPADGGVSIFIHIDIELELHAPVKDSTILVYVRSIHGPSRDD